MKVYSVDGATWRHYHSEVRHPSTFILFFVKMFFFYKILARVKRGKSEIPDVMALEVDPPPKKNQSSFCVPPFLINFVNLLHQTDNSYYVFVPNETRKNIASCVLCTV